MHMHMHMHMPQPTCTCTCHMPHAHAHAHAGGKDGSPGVSLMTLTTFGKSWPPRGFAEAIVYGADNGAAVSPLTFTLTSP